VRGGQRGLFRADVACSRANQSHRPQKGTRRWQVFLKGEEELPASCGAATQGTGDDLNRREPSAGQAQPNGIGFHRKERRERKERPPNPGHQTISHKKARKGAKTAPVFLRLVRFFAAKLPGEKSSQCARGSTRQKRRERECGLVCSLRSLRSLR